MTDICTAVGLTSRSLVIPISEHQDTVGPLARTVTDAAYILQAIAGIDPHDNYTMSIPGGIVPDYVSACKMSGLSGFRLGIPRNVIALHSIDNTTLPMIEAFDQALSILKDAGATIIENTNFTAATEYFNSDLRNVITEADFVVNLPTYLEGLTHNPNNIVDLNTLRNFTKSFVPEDYPRRDVGVWDEALLNFNNTDPRFWKAYQQYVYYGEEGGLLGAIERHDLDAVILPTMFSSDWAAPAQSPIVTVPLGFYPDDAPVIKNSWGLVESAPHIP